MNLVLPREHGAWAMLIVPFVAGLGLGKYSWLHLLLFLGLLFFYLSSYPLLMIVRNSNELNYYKKWLIIYGSLAITASAVPILFYPQLLLLGIPVVAFLLANLYFALVKQERSLFNDLSAIGGLALGAVASGYIASGRWTSSLALVWLLCVAFFMGSVFFVKTMIRERGNTVFLYFSWSYHLLIIIIILVFLGNWLPAAAYLPSLVRAIYYPRKSMKPLEIGKVEIFNSLVFTVLLLAYL